MWAINAVLMSIGVESYIAMRWLFYGLILTCLAIAFIALEPQRRFSGLKAALVTLAALTTLSSLVSYNTAPPYLMLAGASLLALAADTRQKVAQMMLAALSGLALAVGGFLNFTVYPAAVIVLGLAWIARERPAYAWLSLVTMAVVSGAAIAWYLSQIGLETFFRYPGGHGIAPYRLRAGVRLVLEWLVLGWVASAATLIVLRRRSVEERRRAQHTIAAALVLGLSILFLSYLLYKLNLWAFAQRLEPLLGLAKVVELDNLGALSEGLAPHVIALWGISVFVLTMVLCRERDDAYRRVTLFGACLYACFLFQEFFSLMDPRLVPIYYAGPCLALGFFLLLRRPPNVAARLMASSALAVTLAGSVAYSLNYNHPNLNPVLGDKVDVAIPKLTGLKESPERADTLGRLVDAFEDHDCRNRTVVTFNATPVLHYLFDAEPPLGTEYLYVPYIFDADAVLRTLRQSPRWCVFVSWNWLDWPKRWPRPATEPIMDYLRGHSTEIIRLSPRARPVHPYDDFMLYLGPSQ